MKLKELGEFSLIDRIAAKVGQSETVKIAIGDDAAATVPSPGHVILTSTDMLVEGVHFDLSFCDPASLGRKSLSVNLSDIAAMGGYPRHFLLSLAIPPKLDLKFVDSFVDGLLDRGGQFNTCLIGGDTCASNLGLVIAITIMGEQRIEKVVQRRGARPGDLICATGALGDSALGLDLLRQGAREGYAVRRHLDPLPRVKEGIALAEAGIVTAMIDISDGLLADLGHILDSSGAGARLDLHLLPLSASFHADARVAAGNKDPYLYPLCGGEDYELLFTIDPASKDAVFDLLTNFDCPVTVIGEVTAQKGISVFRHGALYPIAARGYDHFKQSP